MQPDADLFFQPDPSRHVSSHLSNDIRIEGNLICSSDLIFDGTIKGNIRSKGSLTIGNNAQVDGDVTSDKAVIEGTVNGNGKFENCRISSTARITGSVTTVALQMEEGASLDGDCKVGRGSTGG